MVVRATANPGILTSGHLSFRPKKKVRLKAESLPETTQPLGAPRSVMRASLRGVKNELTDIHNTSSALRVPFEFPSKGIPEFPSNSLRREFETDGPRGRAPARAHLRSPLPTLAPHRRHPPAGASAPPEARQCGGPALAATPKWSVTCIKYRVLQLLICTKHS